MKQRDTVIVPFELKAIDAGDETRTFEGYGSVFGTLDSYADIVAKGAFKRSLKEWKSKGRAPAMLWQHDAAKPVGVWVEMREDDHGLFVKGQLADTQLGREAYALLKMGALSGLSIGFRTLKSKMDDESGIRTLTEVELWETSLVTFPANDPARITSVKAIDMTERQFEEFLRDAGFPIAAAKTIVAKGYRALRDVAPADEGSGLRELLALANQRGAIFTGANQ